MSKAEKLARVRHMCRTGEARGIREGAGLSLAEMADSIASDMSASTIMRWERGQRVPHGPRALAYFRVLRDLEAVVKR